MASESPERLEELRRRFLEALAQRSGGGGAPEPVMLGELARGAGLDPEGDPEDRALTERIAEELVTLGYATAEASPSGTLVVTDEGVRAAGGGG